MQDLAPDNLVYSEDSYVQGAFNIPGNTVFYIDFGSSRQMASGPGSGVVIHDYGRQGGHFEPPEGREDLNPFAYDIFTIGKTVLETCRVCSHTQPAL